METAYLPTPKEKGKYTVGAGDAITAAMVIGADKEISCNKVDKKSH